MGGCDFFAASVEYDRCVLSAGGGPLDVSIPWLLLEAGARRVAGDRASRPEEPGCGAK